MTEIWKDIKGFEGLYQVSNLGRVKGLKRLVRTGASGIGHREIPEMIKGIRHYPNGYAYVKLTMPKKENPKLLHRIIAEAFIENKLGKNFVNHINGVKSDNRIENLEWCTRSENVRHAIKLGLIKTGVESFSYQRRGDKHPNSKSVRCDTLDIDFECINMAAQKTGVHRLSIGLVCRGLKSHVQGLSFRYI